MKKKRAAPHGYGLLDGAQIFITHPMVFRFLSACLLISPAIHATVDDDVVLRAQRSTLIPTLSLHYSYRHDSPQVVWAGLTWEFDECLFGDRQIVAIQIKRLEREQRYLESTPSDLLRDQGQTLD